MTDGLDTASSGAGERRDPPQPWVMLRPAIAVGVGSGLLFGIATRFMANSEVFRPFFGVMTLSFLCLVPLVIGYLTVRPHPNPSWGYRLLAPWLPTVLSVALCFAVGWEGTICIVMGLPLLLIFSSLGGVFGAVAPVRGPAGAAGAMLLPFLTAPIEQRLPQPVKVHEVRSSILIQADPTTVWAEIVEVPAIQPEEHRPALFTTLGFPRPVSATLSGPGVGAVRHARFEGGVLFLETVTDWVPERLLRFTIAAQTDSIPASTLDPHVTIGGPYFDVLSGRYDIHPGPDGRVTLELISELRVSTRFNLYATPWSDAIMRSIQENILEVIRVRAEARTVGAAPLTAEPDRLCRFDTAAFRDTVKFTYYLTPSLMLTQGSKAVTATAPYLAAIASTFRTPRRITLGSWTGTLGDSDEVPCDHDYWCKVGTWGGEGELKVGGEGRGQTVEWLIRPDAPEAVAAIEASIRQADSLQLIPPNPRIPGLPRGRVRFGLQLTDSAPSGGVPLWRFQLPYIRITEPVGIIEQPRPKWPEGLNIRPGASVILQFIVNENGYVARESIRVLEADANPFIAPSIEAILSSRFRPAQAGSCPVKMLVRQRVRYRS